MFIVEEDKENASTGTVRKVPVELGVASGTSIQVKGKLGEGELVAVVGNERLLDGQRVSITRKRQSSVADTTLSE